MKLDEFLTQALIDSLNNDLIVPELITVYAGNYLAKSLITQDEMTQVTNAITAHQTAQAQETSTSESTSSSLSSSESTSDSQSASDSTTTSESASAS
ncbi:MAG: hypothetical protein ABF690_00305 [Liquorilactobacillus nagelii]|uniref:hypothetical protein n=1 Tax=Oenococcus sicerae TaxID=2203724 RepID=UPI0039EA257E